MVVVQPSLGLLFPSAELVKKKITTAGMENMPLMVVVDCVHISVVDYTAALVSVATNLSYFTFIAGEVTSYYAI